jgi:hypothetical protein
MRLLTHRGQVLLLVVVGVLSCMALCCLGLELMGVPVLEPFGVDELFTRHEPAIPSRIVIEGQGVHADQDQDSTPAPPATVVVQNGVARQATPHPH